MKNISTVRKMSDSPSHGTYAEQKNNKHNSKSMSLEINQNQNQMSESYSIIYNKKTKILKVAFLKFKTEESQKR